jgi:hypothetical protein
MLIVLKDGAYQATASRRWRLLILPLLEEASILRHEGDITAERGRLHRVRVLIVDKYRAGGVVVEAFQQDEDGEIAESDGPAERVEVAWLKGGV